MKTPNPFEIIEIDQGSIEVVINLNFDIAEKLIDLFKTAIEVYGVYLTYKTLVHEKLVRSYKGNKALLEGEVEREKLLLGNIKEAVRGELKEQSKKNKEKARSIREKN